MSKKQMTLVYYYIPEDHDDQDTPNVFGVMMGKNNIRLQHIYDNFPLKGSYIFRFKVMYDNAIAWLDLPDLQTKLPTYKERIIIKATRISWEPNKESPYGHYRFIQKQQASTNSVSTQPTSAKKQIPKQQPVQQTKSQKVTATPPQTKIQTHDLLDDKHEIKIQPSIDFGTGLDLLGSTTSTTAKTTTDFTGLGDLKNLI